jgi:hypothetical protein
LAVFKEIICTLYRRDTEITDARVGEKKKDKRSEGETDMLLEKL